MKTLLQISSSIFSDQGQSSQLAQQFVTQWQKDHANAQVHTRNFATQPVPHLDGERFAALLSHPDTRTPEQQAVVDFSDLLINELKQADILVLGMPMYNFGIPSALKAYIDHIARAGVTFKYTDQGSVGLLTGKKALIFAARGGAYLGTAKDTQSAYIRDFLGFIGITDVEIIYAEGLAMGEESKQSSLTHARAEIVALNALNG